MSSKNFILNKIKESNCVEESPLPIVADIGITFENKIEKFQEVIQTVGGIGIISNANELDEVIAKLYPTVNLNSSNVQECTLGNFNPDEKENPSELKELDLAIVKGEFAVAENGAVWLKNTKNKHRALYFIAQNIVIIVNKNEIVNNMHEAYEKISFDDTGYGTFVSGPSKTADIEQSLVIGAHGPKSGYVIFI